MNHHRTLLCETNNPRVRKWKLTRNLELSWARRERRVEISQTYNPPIPIPITSSRQRNAFERSCSESFLVFICRLLLKSQNMKEKKSSSSSSSNVCTYEPVIKRQSALLRELQKDTTWKRCFDSGLAKDGAWHHLSFPPWFNRAREHLPIHPQNTPDCLYN